MATYRKQPTFFNVPGKSQVHSESMVPFAGLEINDNPLLNTKSSASDMLNMVVDDNYFLTLRPRLENDEVSEKEYPNLIKEIEYQGYQYYYIKDIIKVKESYIVSVGFKYVENEDFVEVFFIEMKENHIGILLVYTNNEFTIPMIDFLNFDNFMMHLEMDYIRFVHKKSGKSVICALEGFAYREGIGMTYIPTYKANVISKETLNTAPIYEDLNVMSDSYRISFQFDAGREDTYSFLSKNSTRIDGSPYVLDKLVDFDSQGATDDLTIRVTYSAYGISPERYVRRKDLDVNNRGIQYYGWSKLNFPTNISYTRVPYITPRTPIYNSSFNQNTSLGVVAKSEVLSYPQMSKEDIVSIENDGVIYVDGGKAEAILNVTPHRIRLSAGWFKRSIYNDGEKYGVYRTAWVLESNPSQVLYTLGDLNIMQVSDAVYFDNGTSHAYYEDILEIDFPMDMSIPFYKVNSVTKINQEIFRLYVGLPGPNGQFIIGNDYAKLFSPIVQYDNNNNRIGKFVYDSLTNALVRLDMFATSRTIQTAKDGGAPLLSSFLDVSSPSRGVTLSVYKVDGTSIKQKMLTINNAIGMTNDEAFDKWRVHYFKGQVVVVWDGTFLGVENLGLIMARTGTEYDAVDFYKFYPIFSSGNTTYSGFTTIMSPAPTRSTYPLSTYYEVISHVVWDGQNVHTITPYDLVELFNTSGTGNLVPDATSPTEASMILYINSIVSSKVYISRLSGKKIATNRMNGSVLVGSQLLLYSFNNDTGYIKPNIIIVPLDAAAATRGYTLINTVGGVNYDIIDLGVTVGGKVNAIFKSGTDYKYGYYSFDFNYNNAIVGYNMFDLLLANDIKTFPFRDNFALVMEDGDIETIVINNTPIEFTYLISEPNNPLRLTNEASSAYNAARNAFLDQEHPFIGSAHISDSRLYYKDNYIFVTHAGNFEYLPVIYSHMPQRKVRHASSYLREVGSIFEQNMIEFVTFVDNPFIETMFIGHHKMPLFEKYEQGSIDYIDTKHLITFFGNTVYLGKGGLYSLTFDPQTSQDDIRKATLVSRVINPKLTKEDVSTAILCNRDPYVLILFPKENKTSVYAYRADYGHWYYWELPIEVLEVQDDNLDLRFKYINDGRYSLAYFTDDPIAISIEEGASESHGSVERYLDFDKVRIPWFWKSQIMGLGTITKKKQLIETYFTFVNNNASIQINTDTNFEVVGRRVTNQEFGVRYLSFNDIVTISPKVEFEDRLNIINNIRRRTYLSRFNYCQLLCYNIDKESQVQDKVRLANILITYKYLTGGK